jgi:DNA polymerase-3 subunit alpha
MSVYELNKRQVEALIGSGAFDSLGEKRSALHSEYENIIDIYIRRAREQNADQMDLFTLGNISARETFGEAYKYKLPDIPEYSVKEKLRQEKDYTGMYFSGHPLDDYAEMLDEILPMPIGAILASFENGGEEANAAPDESLIAFADKQRVTLCGIINAKTVKNTKTGAPMAFITIEDKTGEIELIVFPKIFADNSHILMKDTAICLRGEISAEEGKAPKIIVSALSLVSEGLPEEVTERRRTNTAPLPTTPPPTERERVPSYVPKAPQENKLYLKVPDKTGDIFEKVMNVIMIFEGKTPVIIYNEKERKYEKYGGGVDIRPNMLAYLCELLGENGVVLK